MYDDKQSNSSLCPGTMLRSRYRIEKVLGQGGFGITYSALDVKSRQRVAVKELFPSRCVTRAENHTTISILPNEEDIFQHMRISFEREAKILMQLQHQEGIVRLMHVFSENSTMYYVMELLEGEDLKHRLKRDGPLRWEQLAPILKSVMNALAQIHAVGLIHRDISPDNIFLSKNGARLIDFGSVRNYQSNQSMTVLVKQKFAPLEQFLTSGHQGPWTDIYSLCVTVYFVLTGQLPPPAPDRKLNDKLIPLESLCPDLPRHICAAIQHGMNVLPENRFQSVQQLSRALKLEDNTKQSPRLVCLHGYHAGKSWPVQPDSVLRIGRNTDCDISYPPDYPGVSRVHCEIFLSRDGRTYVRDTESRYGTILQSQEKKIVLDRGPWYCADGAHILFRPQEEYVLMR